MQQTFRCYQCVGDACHVLPEKLSFCEGAIHCWKSTIRGNNGSVQNARGCIAKVEQTLASLTCNNSLIQTNDGNRMNECCSEDLCNNGTFPILKLSKNQDGATQSFQETNLTLTILAPILAVCLIIIIVLYYRFCQRGRKYQTIKEGNESTFIPLQNVTTNGFNCSSSELRITTVNENTLKKYVGNECLTSGSGSGAPSLTKRTLSNDITLVKTLNEGTFNKDPELWHGILLSVENVMVKIYSSRLDAMWTRETEIYTKYLFSTHDNVLGYVGSDIVSKQGCTQMWLITRDHPNGSLRNYLKNTTLDHTMMLKACLSLACGLEFLHAETLGTKTKLPVAHRNLNSMNIFVNNNGECVIGGFEIAATLNEISDVNILQHACKRYMSPELLESTSDTIWSLEKFLQADIYSLSLIIWEICRRCVINDIELDYVLPFSDLLINGGQKPTDEEMRHLIVDNEYRPEIPDHWSLDTIMTQVTSMILECWHTKAAARLPILRVKKTLMKLEHQLK